MIPELHEKAHDGSVKEARMDVVVSRPGGLERRMTDARTVDGKCATAAALGGTEGAFRLAELSLLEQLSWEAAIANPRAWCDSGAESLSSSWPSKQPKHRELCTATPGEVASVRPACLARFLFFSVV